MDYALSLIVPYRDRAEHLSQFIPHMQRFFAPRAAALGGPVLLAIIQQEPGKAFNRGGLINIGFALTYERARAFCFHDVDYLPIDVDYSPPERGWISLLNGGFQQAYDDDIVITQPSDFFGAVTVFAKADFARLNGFSNDYWGWGYEDMDLAMRARIENVEFARRGGVFRTLKHESAGFKRAADGTVAVTDANSRNGALFQQRFPAGVDKNRAQQTSRYREDGLTSLNYRVISANRPAAYMTPSTGLEIITVSI